VATPPYIITLRLDAESASRLDRLRRRYFPPERNHLDAHLTLFHALLPDHLARLEVLCTGPPALPLNLEFFRPRSIGRGVVIEVRSTELVRLHARMRAACGDGLTAQDQQALRPHVTIQNKVAAPLAAATLAEVNADFSSWRGQGLDFAVWRYLGGPWQPHAQLPLPAGDQHFCGRT
jgi:2'-5' RNA ligase